jgi:hypothetical protein
MDTQCQPLFEKDYQFSAESYTQPNELVFSADSEEKMLGVMLTQVDYIRGLSSKNA